MSDLAVQGMCDRGARAPGTTRSRGGPLGTVGPPAAALLLLAGMIAAPAWLLVWAPVRTPLTDGLPALELRATHGPQAAPAYGAVIGLAARDFASARRTSPAVRTGTKAASRPATAPKPANAPIPVPAPAPAAEPAGVTPGAVLVEEVLGSPTTASAPTQPGEVVPASPPPPDAIEDPTQDPAAPSSGGSWTNPLWTVTRLLGTLPK